MPQRAEKIQKIAIENLPDSVQVHVSGITDALSNNLIETLHAIKTSLNDGLEKEALITFVAAFAGGAVVTLFEWLLSWRREKSRKKDLLSEDINFTTLYHFALAANIETGYGFKTSTLNPLIDEITKLKQLYNLQKERTTLEAAENTLDFLKNAKALYKSFQAPLFVDIQLKKEHAFMLKYAPKLARRVHQAFVYQNEIINTVAEWNKFIWSLLQNQELIIDRSSEKAVLETYYKFAKSIDTIADIANAMQVVLDHFFWFTKKSMESVEVVAKEYFIKENSIEPKSLAKVH